MNKYIDSISNDKSLNLKAFQARALSYKISLQQIKEAFYIVKDAEKKGDFYKLSVKCQDAYDNAFGRFVVENKNKKVEMSLRGNSKKAKSSFSFLLIKLNFDDRVPWTVVFDDKHFEYSFKEKRKKKLMIIENEDNFGNITDSFNSEDIDLSEYNFALGLGNYISDRNFTDFLNSYDNVVCFFDIDTGGLKMFSNLDSKTTTNLEFYFSEKMNSYLHKYGNKINDRQYLEVNRYLKIPKLHCVIKAIKESKKFAEQEIFQH